MKKPDEQVAENIIADFKAQGLLSEATLTKLSPKLSAGTLSSADWKIAFETERPKSETK
jgi:hypothetical protein